MANVSLSEAEKTYILHGVEDDFRCDGRSHRDYRPMEIETDIVVHANGSARLRLANTDILVGVKAEIDVPNPGESEEGKIEFFVDCSANATPEFEGRGGEHLANEIINILANAYESPKAFNLKNLCILPGYQCWKLNVDVLILECGGNLFDAVSLAVKAAIHSTRIPKLTAAIMDGGTTDLTLSEDSNEYTKIHVEHVPILITICKIGDSYVVDPSAEEEECSTASVVIAISHRNNEKYISNIHTVGVGSFHPDTLNKCIELGLSVSDSLNEELRKALKLEEERMDNLGRKQIAGFLK